MASGDPMGALQVSLPGADAARRDWRPSGTTPPLMLPVYDFSDSVPEYLYLSGRLGPGYAGGGLTLRASMMSTSASVGIAVFEAGFRRFGPGQDLDVSHSYTRKSVNVGAESTNGARTYFSISFSNGSEIDSLAADQGFSIQLRRFSGVTGSPSDTMVGDAEIVASDFLLSES